MITEDLRRWFKERWVDISRKTKGGKHPPCGRKKASDAKYPKCRPSVRVSSETPETSGEMTKQEKKRAVRKKRTAEAKVSTTGRGRKPVMTSHLNESKKCGCEGKCTCGQKAKRAINFVKKIKGSEEKINEAYTCKFDKVIIEDVNQTCMNKKALVQLIDENNKISYAKGFIRFASAEAANEGNDLEIVNEGNAIGFKNEDIVSIKYFDNGYLKEFALINEGKNKPTNPKLWSKAKSLAKKKFKVYPSAYANGWASKWYKQHGGGWKSVNEEVTFSENDIQKIKPLVYPIIEEIVNAHHAGTMTKKEIKSRDKTAKKVKAKPIKGKDTEENARYRLATYIELRKRGAEPKGKKPKKSKKKTAKKDKD